MDFLNRMEIMLSSEDIEKIKSKSVLIFGLGGVGGSCAETMARSGIGRIGIVDKDVFDVTNINRQIFATMDSIGKNKTDVAEERLLSINPELKIDKYNINFSKETAQDINFNDYDYIVDAIDTVTSKIELIEIATILNIKIISSMGAGNRLDPTAFEVTKIEKTKNDPLARVMRKKLKEKGIKNVPVVCSREIPIKTSNRTPGSISFVPPVCGMILTSFVIRDILNLN